MNLATHAALAVVLGGAFGAGVLLAAVRVPRWSAPSLSRRIAPYVRDIADPRGLTPLSASSLREHWHARRDRLIAMLGGAAGIERRLRQADWDQDATRFRAGQLAWTIVGGAIGGAGVIVLVLIGRMTPPAALLPVLAGFGAAALCDLRLTTAARRRVARVQEELPTILEFLALCLAAGEGMRDALRRVGEIGSGELTGELRRAVVDSGTGSSLADALSQLSRRVDDPALTRTVDHLVAAIERGAPLAEVLQAQAADAREDAKRTLIEQAGRKEILMLLPLVFLILPLSVLFAVFPGVVMLRLGIG